MIRWKIINKTILHDLNKTLQFHVTSNISLLFTTLQFFASEGLPLNLKLAFTMCSSPPRTQYQNSPLISSLLRRSWKEPTCSINIRRGGGIYKCAWHCLHTGFHIKRQPTKALISWHRSFNEATPYYYSLLKHNPSSSFPYKSSQHYCYHHVLFFCWE